MVWVEVKMSKEENWKHVKLGEMSLGLSRPVTYIPNPAVMYTVHRSVFSKPADVLKDEAVFVAQHVVEYNPNFPYFGISIVHALSHAKTGELGYFCFPPLTGNAAEEYSRSWSWIDEYYAHRTLAQYSETLFLFELAAKAAAVAQANAIKQLEDFSLLVHDLSALALYEALIPEVGSAEVVEKIQEAADVWSSVLKTAPYLWGHKELLKTVLSKLPEQERLTKEQYIDSGLEILYSKHITKSETAIARIEYRQQVLQAVKRIKA